MKFVLTIDLGNDAMQTAGDIARALQKVREDMRASGYCAAPEIGDCGRIGDDNGNRVGGWHVEG